MKKMIPEQKPRMQATRPTSTKVWDRIAAMDRAELFDRGSQEIQKRVDLARYWLGFRSRDAISGTLPEKTHFFFDQCQIPQLTQLLRQRLPDEAQQVVDRAERICAHRFDLLGYADLDYGREIDWHLDQVHKKRAPRKPWYKIHYLDFEQVGDVKVTWELNRHQHLVTLAKAYRICGETRFANEALTQFNHWLSQNPYPIGVNWASSLEVAFRSLSWLWLRALLDDAIIGIEKFRLDCVHALAVNARHIEHYLSTYFSPNTHLLGEGVALFFIGTLHPELPRAQKWKKLGWKIVLQEAQRQVLADGMHFEQSTYYHVYALDLFLHAALLAARNDIPVPEELDRTLEKMAEALWALGYAALVPCFGDDDGGRVFDPQRNQHKHLLDPLATAAVVFGRGDFKLAAGEMPEESLWLLGQEGTVRFDDLAVTLPVQSSTAFPSSGVYSMASPSPSPKLLVMATGSQELPLAGHGHADALSIQVVVNGHTLLRDSGACGYCAPGQKRNLFRGTAAHNTMKIDRLDQSDTAGPFSWATRARGQVKQWVSGETFDFLAASHDGYTRLPGSPVHQRSVFHRKSRFWLVRDRVEGVGNHHLQLAWHIGPNLVRDPEQQRFMTADRYFGLGILWPKDHGWAQIASKEWWSPAYGKTESTPVIRLEREFTLPAEIVTVLVPTFEAYLDLGELVRTSNRGATPATYQYNVGDEEHHFFFADNMPWRVNGWSSDAEFLYCCAGPDVKEIVFCNGSYVDLFGTRIVSSEQRVGYVELIQCAQGAKILGPNANSLRLHSWPRSLRKADTVDGTISPCQ